MLQVICFQHCHKYVLWQCQEGEERKLVVFMIDNYVMCYGAK